MFVPVRPVGYCDRHLSGPTPFTAPWAAVSPATGATFSILPGAEHQRQLGEGLYSVCP